MNEVIKDLIKQFKDDLEKNNFRSIIYNCPPMFMQELMGMFQYANITIPDSSERQYADICCFLAYKFEKISLCSINWKTGEDVFIFDTSGFNRVKFDELRAHLYTFNADLVKVNQDWNGVCQLTVRIFNHLGDHHGQSF